MVLFGHYMFLQVVWFKNVVYRGRFSCKTKLLIWEFKPDSCFCLNAFLIQDFLHLSSFLWHDIKSVFNLTSWKVEIQLLTISLFLMLHCSTFLSPKPFNTSLFPFSVQSLCGRREYKLHWREFPVNVADISLVFLSMTFIPFITLIAAERHDKVMAGRRVRFF